MHIKVRQLPSGNKKKTETDMFPLQVIECMTSYSQDV